MKQGVRIVWICEWCGGVTTADIRCPCEQQHDPVAARRRHREATARARRTDAAVRGARRAAA